MRDLIKLRNNSFSTVSGFSLLELLVVISILGIFLAVAAPSLAPARMFELDGGSKQIGAFYEAARAEAMSYGEPVRVMIHTSSSDQSTGFLQKVIAVRRQEETAGTNVYEWIQFMNPLILPGGIYFDFTRPGVSTQKMMFPGIDGTPHQWTYYEIQPHGAASGKERNLVIGPGLLESGTSRPQFSEPEKVSGIRITDAGRILPFRKMKEIESWSQ